MEQTTESTFDKINNAIKHSTSIKLLTIGLLIAILLIPNSMIKSLISERQTNQFIAEQEVSQSWAKPLELTGPILTVPYEEWTEGENGSILVRNYVHFLPEELNINGSLNPQTRKRGIYEVIVYDTQLSLKGQFDKPNMSAFTKNPEKIFWEEATISIGIPDMRGIQSNISFQLAGESHRMESGIPNTIELDIAQDGYKSGVKSTRNRNNQTGVHTTLSVDTELSSLDFSTNLNIRGTKEITFNPVGKTTHIKLTSDWPHPSFTGEFLPDSHEISNEGFTAEWSVFDLNRNYPQQWQGLSHEIASADFGVQLFQPVDNYRQNERSAKYAVLVLFLTFISFFFIEVLNKKRIHPVQYVLVGLSLTIFYSLLLSLSEIIGFGYAYLAAAIIIILMLSSYSLSILKSKRLSAFMLVFCSIIYSFIYLILSLEDLSLLVGNFGLVIAIGLSMYLSRKVDWYNLKTRSHVEQA